MDEEQSNPCHSRNKFMTMRTILACLLLILTTVVLAQL